MRERRNPFQGDSYKSNYAIIIYEMLKSREHFTYQDVYKAYEEKHGANNSHATSKAPNKAFKEILELLPDGAVECTGNNRGRKFRYVGKDEDPLAELIQCRAIQGLEQYWRFCQDSAGFFPMSWLEHFFAHTLDLLHITKNKKERVLISSADLPLKNIELLPVLYKAIVNRKILSLTYEPFGEPAKELIFHPHLLKEFNGRWHLLGHAESEMPEMGFCLALDRIVGKPENYYMSKYKPADKDFYARRFKDVIGLSSAVGELEDKAYTIRVRAHNKYMFGLMETKKLHDSQKTAVPFGEYEDGMYGEFTLEVIVNNEFIGRIFQMGDGLEVMSPPEVREVFRQRALKLSGRYEVE